MSIVFGAQTLAAELEQNFIMVYLVGVSNNGCGTREKNSARLRAHINPRSAPASFYSASGLKSSSKLFVFSVLWHILLSVSSIKCHKRARFGENVAELLLIPYICMNHIENESMYHIYSILYTRFFRQSAKFL